MDITQLQAGNAGTCAINAAAANGYTPGQVYTIQMTATGEHAFEPSAGTVTGNKYNQPSIKRFGRQFRLIAFDNPHGLKSLDSIRAGRGSEANSSPDFRHTQSPILL